MRHAPNTRILGHMRFKTEVSDSFVQWLLPTKNEHNSVEVRLIKMVTSIQQ